MGDADKIVGGRDVVKSGLQYGRVQELLIALALVSNVLVLGSYLIFLPDSLFQLLRQKQVFGDIQVGLVKMAAARLVR